MAVLLANMFGVLQESCSGNRALLCNRLRIYRPSATSPASRSDRHAALHIYTLGTYGGQGVLTSLPLLGYATGPIEVRLPSSPLTYRLLYRESRNLPVPGIQYTLTILTLAGALLATFTPDPASMCAPRRRWVGRQDPRLGHPHVRPRAHT